jgi:hypothetical protein
MQENVPLLTVLNMSFILRVSNTYFDAEKEVSINGKSQD